MKSRLILPSAIFAGGVLTIVWWSFQRHLESERIEQERYLRAETRIMMSNLAGATLRFSRAGKDLAAATPLPVDGTPLWLLPGNYFVTAVVPGRSWSLPIPLKGFRSGPEEDGTFLVTLRPYPSELPPRLNARGPHYAYIPGGYFLIGDQSNPREPHHVWLTGYFIHPFEATNEEMRQFLDDPDGYAADTNWSATGRKWKSENSSHSTAMLRPGDRDYGRFGRPDQPVVWVTWYEANAFCRWMTRKLGGNRWWFSLPTDAEWEKGARGPDNFDYALGDAVSDDEIGLYNWKKNPNAPVTVVGLEASYTSYRPNRFGLYHMTGNVAEWSQSVSTPHNRDHPYLDDERNLDETPGLRSARGGSWYSAATSYLYIPYRDAFQPEHSSQELGFRVVARPIP